jgi:hypothetical protein
MIMQMQMAVEMTRRHEPPPDPQTPQRPKIGGKDLPKACKGFSRHDRPLEDWIIEKIRKHEEGIVGGVEMLEARSML